MNWDCHIPQRIVYSKTLEPGEKDKEFFEDKLSGSLFTLNGLNQ